MRCCFASHRACPCVLGNTKEYFLDTVVRLASVALSQRRRHLCACGSPTDEQSVATRCHGRPRGRESLTSVLETPCDCDRRLSHTSFCFDGLGAVFHIAGAVGGCFEKEARPLVESLNPIGGLEIASLHHLVELHPSHTLTCTKHGPGWLACCQVCFVV